ncbi:hypothetical protein MTBBW1_1470016 [Desulfamplus magnetovallimortis]|uniref:Uncharacterized protein n=1 Tax=Desulfamplus magnetovallimortis TaxID=1246637 RepID=A0A1W1H8C0_9BACT|nr:hypothetical protein [Desulfamplus magnetovallimortis]SLM28703.1 hypothetical protein MTBBW1_1470016 [Desulfamplus magnetovallimortis]
MIFDVNTFVCRIKTATLFEILYRLNRKYLCLKLKRNLNRGSEFPETDADYILEKNTTRLPSFHKLQIMTYNAPMLKSGGVELNVDNEFVHFEKQARDIIFPAFR